ncbi:MAG: hypothetical protein HYR88_13670 [Verrucomicrobia bacterium]|nr:hypothetical protein [Verrucomicrobiota bacterium]MBI3869612.1 hypothetical protein [Verrucomicrobiota bacterium]
MDSSYFSPDILEFIELLHTYQVQYVVVGGEAVIYYGHARLTGDIDFLYDAGDQNAAALFRALADFWKGNIPGIERVDELQQQGAIIQFGRPPNRIDLLNQIDGVGFTDAWSTRVTVTLRTKTGEQPLFYLGLASLIRNKEASGRPRDLEDLEFLRKLAR